MSYAREAAKQLDTWGWSYGTAVSDTAAHLVAELAANAVEHGRVGGRDFRLRLVVPSEHRTRSLRIEVTDARTDRLPSSPGHHEPGRPDAESGRGLLLVEALADRWGCDTSDALTKTVWAEIALP